MDKSESKIHQLDSNTDRAKPGDKEESADRGSEKNSIRTDVRPDEANIRYVTIPQFDADMSGQDDSIDLFALWEVVYKFKGVLLGSVLLALLLSVATALLMSPVYRAELIVAPVTEEKGGGLSALAGQFGGLASLAGVNIPSGGGNVDRVLATLKSRAFLLPLFAENNVFKVLSSPESTPAPTPEPTSELDSDEKMSPLEVYTFFIKTVMSVSKDSKTGLVTLSIEWSDPEVAAQWANMLVLRLNEHQRQTAIFEAEQNIDYLNSQLQKTSVVDMQQMIYQMIESETKAVMLANVKKDFSLEVIDPAVAPEKRIRPRRSLIVVLGLVMGLMMGVFLVFVLHAIGQYKLRAAPV
ncbi:MAG: hypothetical protein COB30_014910 [Ectothiorhodospiraceae bacterium]|nr:hypothetical protein [Ectothiorhodospiraceae bacterium]